LGAEGGQPILIGKFADIVIASRGKGIFEFSQKSNRFSSERQCGKYIIVFMSAFDFLKQKGGTCREKEFMGREKENGNFPPQN